MRHHSQEVEYTVITNYTNGHWNILILNALHFNISSVFRARLKDIQLNEPYTKWIILVASNVLITFNQHFPFFSFYWRIKPLCSQGNPNSSWKHSFPIFAPSVHVISQAFSRSCYRHKRSKQPNQSDIKAQFNNWFVPGTLFSVTIKLMWEPENVTLSSSCKEIHKTMWTPQYHDHAFVYLM
jgi:hypothetical protein